MNKKICYFLLAGIILSNTIVTIKKDEYTISDFYQEYGKKDWDHASLEQKKELAADFINRRIAALEATAIGLHNKPDIAKKLHDRYSIALVNTTYEERVAKPLISNELLDKTKKHIIEERLLSHILIGHNTSRSQENSDRSIDDAFLLAQKISKELNNGANFTDYVIKYSEDPTAFQNEGRLDWITWGRTIPAFQEQAFILQKGEFSRPVLTDFGYHIIFCEDIRPSEYALLSSGELEDVVYIVSRNTVSNQLPIAAMQYDSTQLANYGVQYNDKALDVIMDAITEQTNQNKISGQYKINLIDLFSDLDGTGVVVILNDKGYGIKWFAERFKMLPSGRHPQIVDLESLKQAFNIIILQYIAVEEGYKHNVHTSSAYKKQKEQLYQSLLYDQYLKWLVNNAEEPDSSSVTQYYMQNRDEKYLEQEKVVVREIKVLDQTLADSLRLELKYGSNFIQLAKLYSKTNPHDGGKVTPFTKGKYNQMGDIAFSLGVGEISNVITNLDRTYSIIKVEEFIKPEYIPVDRVYNRIESVLKRNNQKDAKENGLKQLKYKYNVMVNL